MSITVKLTPQPSTDITVDPTQTKLNTTVTVSYTHLTLPTKWIV